MRHKLILIFLCLGLGLAACLYGYTRPYVIAYAPIHELTADQYDFDEFISSVLPKTVTGVNEFGFTRSFPVTYVAEGRFLNKEDRFYFYANEESRRNLGNFQVPLSVFVDQRPAMSIALQCNFDQAIIKPTVATCPSDDHKTLEIISNKAGPAFKIEWILNQESLKFLLEDKQPYVLEWVNGHPMPILNSHYIDLKESDFFDLLQTDQSLEHLGQYREAIKESFDALPFELKEYAVYNGLHLRAEDFAKDAEKRMSAFSKTYEESITKAQYIERTGAYFDSLDNQSIVFNLSGAYKQNDRFYEDFSNYIYELSINKYEAQVYYQGREVLSFANRKDMQSHFYKQYQILLKHELMHYFDQQTRSLNEPYLTEAEMRALRPMVNDFGYAYLENRDYEFIAYASHVYFDNPEYLKQNAPAIYEAIEHLLGQLDNKKKEQFDHYLSQYKS